MNDTTTVDASPGAPAVPPPTSGVKSPEIIAAEKAVSAILTGLKNFGAFPPEHARTINLLQGVLRTINQYVEQYGSLIFEVGGESLFYQGKPLVDGSVGDDNPAVFLSKVGIRRLEFVPGLEESELGVLFRLCIQYRVVGDESADDLVSALWRAELTHILHEATCHLLWSGSEPAVDFGALASLAPDSQFGPEVTPSQGKAWEALRLESTSENYSRVSLALLPNLNDFCVLTEVEREALAAMVAEDTQAGDSEAAVRLILLLLGRESDLTVCEAALTFLQDVYLDFLANRAFQRAFYIIDNIRKEAIAAREVKSLVMPAYKKFYDVALQPESIGYLVEAWPHFAELGVMEVKALSAILQQLPVKVSGQLIARLGTVENPEARQLFVEVIAQHARRDREVLAAGLNSEVEPLVLAMVTIIGTLNDRSLVEQFLPKFRYDSRGSIRKECVRILASQGIY